MLFWNYQVIMAQFIIGLLFYGNNACNYSQEACLDGSSSGIRVQVYCFLKGGLAQRGCQPTNGSNTLLTVETKN